MTSDFAIECTPVHFQERNVTQLNFSTWLQILQTTFILPTSMEGFLHTSSLVLDSSFCKQLFSYQFARGESCPPKHKWMSSDMANHWSCPLERSESYPNTSTWLQKSQTTFLLANISGGTIPTQPLVLDIRCCKWLFFYQLARGSVTHPNSGAWLLMLKMNYLLPIGKERINPI